MSTALDRIIEEVKALTREERRQLLKQLEEQEGTIENQSPTLPRRPGTLRGTVKYMSPDFDAPLDDFREYME